MRLGYFLSSEEWGPNELVAQARMAREAGFDRLWISDHYHPWNDEQGHSPFVWSTIAAIAAAVPGMTVTTAVTCPTMRIHPAVIAQAAATSAADTIANAASFNEDAVFLEAVAAKIRCAEAAERGGAIAHQVHGAIGFTMEHILHRYSLRALSWRDDFGSESYWAVELGKLVAARGADELWPLVASR